MSPSSGNPGSAPDVSIALASSNLGSLPYETRSKLLESGTLLRVPAGGTLHREGDAAAHLQLVVMGLLRVYVTAADGRTMTVRYCRPGSILGAVSLFSTPFSMPAAVQAVTEAQIFAMPAGFIKDAAERDPTVARAIIDELSDRVLSFISEIPGSAFATVRQRVARHLLDLASAGQHGSELTVRISQQALADAVGTVREVVVRALRELREEGMVETGSAGTVLLDPQRLSSEAYPN